MGKRRTFDVTLSDAATGTVLASATRCAMSAGIAASEGLVRQLARGERTLYVRGRLMPRARNSSDPYVQHWTSQADDRRVVARVALAPQTIPASKPEETA